MGRENAQAKKCAVIGQRGKVNPKSNVAYPAWASEIHVVRLGVPDFESSSQVSCPKQGVAGGQPTTDGEGVGGAEFV